MDDLENTITIGKNRPLVQERLKWKSDVPVTLRELKMKREEFWDTAPAFEGRKEIWDAIKAAALQAEQGDFALAQAILDGACVALPDGTLRESYDELGCRYKVPVYCLSLPTNMADEQPLSSRQASETSLSRVSSDDSVQLVPVKLRLSSTGRDVCLMLKSGDSVAKAKRRLCTALLDLPPPRDQRWLYGGKLLTDRKLIRDYKIPAGFVIQVDSFVRSNNGAAEQQQRVQPSSAVNVATNHNQQCNNNNSHQPPPLADLDSKISVVSRIHRRLSTMSSSSNNDAGNHRVDQLPTPVDT